MLAVKFRAKVFVVLNEKFLAVGNLFLLPSLETSLDIKITESFSRISSEFHILMVPISRGFYELCQEVAAPHRNKGCLCIKLTRTNSSMRKSLLSISVVFPFLYKDVKASLKCPCFSLL